MNVNLKILLTFQVFFIILIKQIFVRSFRKTDSNEKSLKIDFKKGERTGGTLYVETYGGAFALELQTKSKFLIDKVNVFFGYQAIQQIKIVQNSKQIENVSQDVTKPQKILVTDEEENYIEQISSGLNSEGLGNVLQKLGRAIFNDNKKRNKNV